MVMMAVVKLDQIQKSVDEVKKTLGEQKQDNTALEIGLIAVAVLGVILALAALWQTARLNRRLLEHAKHKEIDLQ